MKIISLFIFFVSVPVFGQINVKDSQGRKQGVWKKPYSQNTQFKYVGQFKDDRPYGKFVYYYENGAVEAVIHFKPDGTAKSKMYHESGYMMAKGNYINQKKDSLWTFYDDRGYVSYQEEYKGGKLHGQRVVYFEPQNGKYPVMEYSNWKNGVQHGDYKKYHPNMKLAEEGKWVDGQRTGIVKHYYPSGKQARIERYQFGVKHGYWVFYSPEGEQAGYHLYWHGKRLKGEALKAREAYLKAQKQK
jgi:antitoxin component YwqK of YwqJK toxin-antitoxin module